MKGIDVSYYQGNINWKNVYRDGFRFAMIKATQGTNIVDPRFEENIVGAYSSGLACGTYHYFTAYTKEDAIAEAEHFIRTMEPYKDCIKLWAAIDVENREHQDVDKELLTNIVIAFCERVKEAGFKPMLYANGNFISYHYNYNRLRCYPLWYACWYAAEDENDKPTRDYDYLIWQHGLTQSSGIGGDVDGDYGYFDLPQDDPIEAGDVVKIQRGSYYYNTRIEVPDFVLENSWIVETVNDDRVVINKSIDGLAEINSAVYAADCFVVGNVDNQTDDPIDQPPKDDDPAPPQNNGGDEAGQDTVINHQPAPVDPGDDTEDDEDTSTMVKFFKMLLKALLIAVRSVFGKGGTN